MDIWGNIQLVSPNRWMGNTMKNNRGDRSVGQL